MNRSKDTIDLAFEELERAIAESRGEPYPELSESELVVETVEELTPLTVTTPNLLDTALYESSDDSNPYHSSPSSEQSDNYQEAAAALHTIIDCLSRQQHVTMVSSLPSTTHQLKAPSALVPKTPIRSVSSINFPNTPQGYKSIGTMPRTPAGIKSTATDPMTPIGMKSTATMPSTPPRTRSVGTFVETPMKYSIGTMSSIPTKTSKSTMPKTPQKN